MLGIQYSVVTVPGQRVLEATMYQKTDGKRLIPMVEEERGEERLKDKYQKRESVR